MKVLFDTSVLVAAMVAAHPAHARALPWLSRAKKGEVVYSVGAHSLAELYAVLSRLPPTPRLTPEAAARLIHDNVETHATVVTLSASDYNLTIKRLAERGLAGGQVYDALIARAAEKCGADRLLTLDPEDFRRVWPEGLNRITAV